MGGLSHYLEEEGLATTQISLIREHTEIMRPPRALWVPFDLGRPFGVPNDAAFQTRVLLNALELLEAAEGPILSDFPEDAPESDSPPIIMACPVYFAGNEEISSSTDRLLNAFRDELSQMTNWYELARQNSGRTTASLSGLTPEEIMGFLADFLRGKRDEWPIPEVTTTDALRMAAEDLKACYFEALTAQPGQTGDSLSMANWFWGQTVAAQVINAIREVCLGITGNDYQLLGKLLLVPRTQLHRFKKNR